MYKLSDSTSGFGYIYLVLESTKNSVEGMQAYEDSTPIIYDRGNSEQEDKRISDENAEVKRV